MDHNGDPQPVTPSTRVPRQQRRRAEREAAARERLEMEYVAIDLLRPDPGNPWHMIERTHDTLTDHVREFDVVQPIVARRADNVVIGGHQRLLAARRLGMQTVPVIWLDVSVERSRLLGLGLNQIHGEPIRDLLAQRLAELVQIPELDLSLTGFDQHEIQTLLRSLDARAKRDRLETFDVEVALDDASRIRRVSRGEIWALGEHRLMCGDATDRGDLERLLDGRRADLVWTDPPYRVALGSHPARGTRSKHRPIANDDLSPEAWVPFTRAWARNLLELTDGALYVAMSCQEWPTVAGILAEAGAHWSSTVIWAKDRFTLGRSDYQRGFEPLWYGWREGASHHWCGDRDQSDVWSFERPADSPLHPVMKPVPLIERAIRNSSQEGALVLDAFAGSGSTVIACERTGRRAAVLEIDPLYADVILARWEKFTGGTAERIEMSAPGLGSLGVS